MVYLFTPQILTIPVKAVIAVGSLTCFPKHMILPPSFPVRQFFYRLLLANFFPCLYFCIPRIQQKSQLFFINHFKVRHCTRFFRRQKNKKWSFLSKSFYPEWDMSPWFRNVKQDIKIAQIGEKLKCCEGNTHPVDESALGAGLECFLGGENLHSGPRGQPEWRHRAVKSGWLWAVASCPIWQEWREVAGKQMEWSVGLIV